MKKFEILGSEGQVTVASTEIYAKKILVVQKDGEGFSKIISGSPTGKAVQYASSYGVGAIVFPMPLTQGEPVLVLYEDDGGTSICEAPVVQTPITFPLGIVGSPYNASFSVSGTQPFVLSSKVLPDGLSANVNNGFVEITGTPTTEGVQAISFTITNCAGANSVNFSNNINVSQNNISWSFANVGGSGNLHISLNSVVIIDINGTDSASFYAPIGSQISVTVTTTRVTQATINITGPYTNSTTDIFIVGDTFTVASGGYVIYTEAD